MKKILILLPALVLLAALSACRVEKVQDDGPQVTRHIQAAGFSSIALAIPAEVTYIPSDTFGVDVSASEDAIRKLDIRVKGGQLCIGTKDRTDRDGNHYIVFNGRHNSTSITVRAPRLTGVLVAGSCSFVCNDTLRTDRFDFTVEGSGSIDAKCIEAERVTISVAGSGDIDAALARVALTDISIAGSGDADVSFAACTDVHIGGRCSGDIDVDGDVGSLSKNIAGSGDIDTDKLIIKK